MKYLKISFFFSLCFTMFISPLFVYAINEAPSIGDTWGEAANASGYDSVDGQIKSTNNLGGGGVGYYIKLIKYNSNTKEETVVGKPVLLQSGGLLDDITRVDSGAGLAGVDTSSKGNTLLCIGSCAENIGNSSAPNSGQAFHIQISDNPISYGQQIGEPITFGNATYYAVTLEPSGVDANGKLTWSAADNCESSSRAIYSAEQISYYKKSDIKFLFDSSSTDSGASSKWGGSNNVNVVSSVKDLSTVSIYEYARDYLFGSNPNYSNGDSKLFRNNDGKGIVTLDKIFSAFSINASQFDMANMDSYYFAIEPVTREKTNSVVRSWSSSQSSVSVSGSPSWRWSCEYGGSITTNNSSQPGQGTNGCTEDYDCDWKCTKSKYDSATGKEVCTDWGYTNTCTRYGKWTFDQCASIRYTRTSILITNHAEKVSVIQPAREGTSVDAIKLVTTSIDQPESKHCILDKDNECTGTYEHFIGPNLKTALVGTITNNKYQLYDKDKNVEFTRASADVNAVGVSYWWLPDLMTCKQECVGKSGDDLLMCAENFCDNSIGYDERANTQKLKANCIISTCGYTYTPVSCATANPYMSSMNRVNVAESSTCGFTADGKRTEESKQVNVTCVDDANNDIFDQKRYINIACKEETGFGFTNLIGKKIVAGQGIDYYVNQIGYRECSIFWDTATWKFAYASYHSQDKIEVKGEEISTREQLVRMLNYFNTAQDNYFTETVGIDLAGNEYSNGDFSSWNSFYYNKDVNIETEVKEVINNNAENTKYNLVESYSNPASQADVIRNDGTKAIFSLQSVDYKLNYYLQKSDITKTYTFDKYCVSKDGLATIKKAEGNGTCPNEEGFVDDELGKNVYYTNLNATANKNFSNGNLEHSVNTTISDGKSSELMSGESCPYEIEGPSYECLIDIVATEGTEMHGNGIYAKGSVTASLIVKEKLGTKDNIKTTEIKVDNRTDDKSLTISMKDTRNGHEQYDIEGRIETVNGEVATCRKRIYLINPDDNCGAQCSIEKVSDYVYKINSVGSQTPRNYFSASSVNFSFVKLAPDVRNGTYLVRVDKRRTDYYLYGKVSGIISALGDSRNGSSCNDVCWIKIPCEGPDCELENYNCEAKYAGANYAGIKDYCEKNWDLDINHYESIDECKKQCGISSCPENVRDLTTVEEFCEDNYDVLGYDKAINCVNYCYYCPECSSEYVYRQVNIYNPFPKSNDSNTLGYNYMTGDRVIGSNWVGKSEYIKLDDNDTTSVTGAYANQNVEYVIELTPDDIKRIKENTASYNFSSEENDAYLDYIYQEDTDVNGKYYSKFINEEFRDSFTVIDGNVVG